MSRNIGAANVTHVTGPHVHTIWLVKFVFDTPVYVHSGIGNIPYDSNTYVGVGGLGSITGGDEVAGVVPSPLFISLTGFEDTYITEALDAGNYGDSIIVYKGYRGSDGALVADPWVRYGGFFETAGIEVGDKNTVTITVLHELARLEEKSGRRWTDEDQQAEYSGDTFFSFAADVANVKLVWAGHTVGGNVPDASDPRRDR